MTTGPTNRLFVHCHSFCSVPQFARRLLSFQRSGHGRCWPCIQTSLLCEAPPQLVLRCPPGKSAFNALQKLFHNRELRQLRRQRRRECGCGEWEACTRTYNFHPRMAVLATLHTRCVVKLYRIENTLTYTESRIKVFPMLREIAPSRNLGKAFLRDSTSHSRRSTALISDGYRSASELGRWLPEE